MAAVVLTSLSLRVGLQDNGLTMLPASLFDGFRFNLTAVYGDDLRAPGRFAL
jgi:hypothetical protein